jgi:two-component system chemotaxis sensor kinase CheA
MIIKDKQAYLYDSAFSNLETISGAFEGFIDYKKRLVEAYLRSIPSSEEDKLQTYGEDLDLFQVREMSLESLGIQPDGQIIKPNRLFITAKDREKIDRKSIEEFLEGSTQAEVKYTNKTFFGKYKKKISYLLPPLDEMRSLSHKAFLEKRTQSTILYKENISPRLIIIKFDEKTNLIYCFDFFFDQIIDKFVTKSAFANYLVNRDGDAIFQNRPETFTPSHKRFFKRFNSKFSNLETKKDPMGVQEQLIGNEQYILGYKRIKNFPDYFIFCGIKTSEAYEVTTMLIATTLTYVLLLVAVFNIISLFLARSITGPIDEFIGVIKTIADGKYNVRVENQSTLELQMMADTFNSMVQKIQDYNVKLQEYNRTLEQKVEERTAKLKKANNFIKTMVDSLAQGLLVFDRSGLCLDLYTKACEKLMGINPSNRPLAEVVNPEDSDTFRDWVTNLFDEMIPFESIVELGPKSLSGTKDYKALNFKHVTLDFFPMRSEEGIIENVVMVATDKTREFKAQKQIVEEQNYVKLVTKVINDKKNFLRFIDLFETSLKEEAGKIKVNNEINKNDFMRLLHSMKGSASFYNFSEIVSFLHQFETDFSQDTLDIESTLKKIDEALELLRKNIQRLRDFLGDNKEQFIEIPEKHLRTFWATLQKENPVAAKKFSSSFLEIPAEKYIDQYKNLIKDLAPKLGKSIHPMVVINGALSVDMNHFQKFFDSCIHLFRNAVDHGIEKPEVRLQNGKDQSGLIRVSFETDVDSSGQRLVFHVQDDGGGIDPLRVRNKMKELGYSEDQINESDEDIIYHIFDPSFSTAEILTDVSGRGVGLFDIKENVNELGGHIELNSLKGRGTVFTFKLPIVHLA